MKFTDSSIRAIKPKAERYEVWETNGKGFGLRISPAGKKSWVYLYRFEGRARRMTLGEFPDVSLADAHEKHAKAKMTLSKGTDPGELDQNNKAAHRNAFTVAHLVDEYMERWARPRKVTWKEDERCLNKEVIPLIGHRKAKDIKRRDIVKILDGIVDRVPAMANRTKSVITKLFNFGVDKGILEVSPCVALSLPAEPGERHRALNDGEIKTLWTGLDNTNMEPLHQLALKFLLVTAQRRSEVVKAQWQEFDLNDRVWEIPLERIKTRKKKKNAGPHVVPLSDLALELLQRIKELSGDSLFLFPSMRTGRHIEPVAVTKTLRRVLGKDYEDRIKIEEHFTLHDLRRSATTGMTSIGIPQFNVSKVLNHDQGSVTGIYDRHGYLSEKRDALDRWGQKLERIITGEKAKIVNIRK